MSHQPLVAYLYNVSPILMFHQQLSSGKYLWITYMDFLYLQEHLQNRVPAKIESWKKPQDTLGESGVCYWNQI